MSIDERFSELMNMFGKYNFDYILTDDLDKWKQGINKEYLLRKKLKEMIDELGYDSIDKLMSIVKNKMQKNMLYDVEDRVMDLIFLPYLHKANCEVPKSHSPSQIRLVQGNKSKNKIINNS